ncbi:MAG TPA: helix-turn-helix domain-containing protein, partial [Isosphaeraceae bacterium]
LIAATHRDLEAWSAEGKFRLDLYYRLGVFTIHLTPLRQRGDDLPLLVHLYVRRFNRELSRDVREVTAEAMERLCSYHWPGNIRELQSILKQALLRATGPVLVPAFLPESLGGPLTTPASAAGDEGVLQVGPFLRRRMEAGSEEIYQEAHQHLDRLLLPLVLGSTDGNKLQAARLLGITRKTLRVKLRTLGLPDPMPAEGDEDDALEDPPGPGRG